MTNRKKPSRHGWLVFAIVVGTALGVVTGDLVWWVAVAIVVGIIAEEVRSNNHSSDAGVHKDAA